MGRHAIAPTTVMLVQQHAVTSRSIAETADENASRLPTLPSKRIDQASFTETFGLAGIPLLLVAVGCICWTVWLISLTANPNATANYLMNTQEFDNGTFWLIIDPSVTVLVFGVIGLCIVLLGHVFVVLQMRWHLTRLKSLTTLSEGESRAYF